MFRPHLSSCRQLAFALCTLVVLPSSAMAELKFNPALGTSVTACPDGVAVGDFNSDGHLDLAVSACKPVTVSILIGNGDGTFKTPVTYDSGDDVEGIAAADVNGDGILDVVVAVFNDNVDVLLGKGDGTFQAAISSSAGQLPNAVTVGDFNRDGKMDLAVSNRCLDLYCDANGGVTVLRGAGDGRFRPSLQIRLNDVPLRIISADLNNDGNLDLVTAGSLVCVMLGNGDGTFQDAIAIGVGIDVDAGDLNHDGNLDLVSCNPDVVVHLGNGDGTFQPGTRFADTRASGSVKVADFNNDGNLDAVVVDLLGSKVNVLVGNGDGTLQPGVPFGVRQYEPDFVATGDFNGDRRKDLAVVGNNRYSAAFVSVLLNASTR